MSDKIKNNKTTIILIAVYCLLAVWIILFKMDFSIIKTMGLRGINLIPFYYKNEVSFHFREVMYNVAIFIPIGIYLQMLKVDLKKSILFGFSFSMILEILQYILKVGITDITDLITNTSGVVIGFLIYMALTAIVKKSEKLDKTLKILATIVTVLMVAFLAVLIIVN